MSVCFSLREVKVVDGEGTQVIWSSSLSGANKLLALFPEKESRALMQDLIPGWKVMLGSSLMKELKLMKRKSVR